MGSRDDNNAQDHKNIPMSPLPPYQRAEMWDITEDDFWRKNAVQRQEQYAQASQRWNHRRQSIMARIRCLEAEARQLREKEDKLSRELMAVRSQAAIVNETFSHESQLLSNIDVQHNMEKQDLFKKHEKIEHRMHDWFKRCRNQDGVHERQWALPELIDKRPPERQLKLPPLANLDLLRQQTKHDDRIVAIIDADGTILDKLQYLGLSNERTATISARAVLQPIKLREAQRFHEATKPSIYSIADGKGTGWISCMIQATGSLQKRKCQGCANSESPFEGCIAVGGRLFPKCGNYVSVSGFKAVNQASIYRRGSKASVSSCPTSRQMTPLTFRQLEFATPSSCDITKENLVLRHNGSFYTYPACIEGVPVDKITPNHPYWEPKWPDLRTLVEPVLRSWEEKYQSAEEASRRGEAVGSVKYQYGRQVNRGNRILKFLEQGAISPYQLLSKRFMSVGKGSITSYDTLFRLCETIEALANYKTDVEPVDWLRQRLHELIEAQGTGFNFSKTIHDFYNDPKLAALRQKSGFKSIGRPSGIKMPRRRAGSVDEAPLPPRPCKRKSPHSYGAPSPPTDSIGEPSAADADGEEGPDGKKQKAAARVLDSLETGDVSDADSWSGAPIAEYDFRIYQIKTRLFTSSEEVTQYWGWVAEHSTFEHQVLEETNPVVWGVHREPIDFSLRLEDVVKISWNLKALRVYLVMSDRQICFEDDKPRGDIMVAFKRENTMRRFIKFCRREEIELVEETWKKMEHLWGTMQSERLPAGEEEPSARLQE
ncbi:hypothetical protein LMH87_010678 [Akanthomyces muscarius]|uniref:Uncharacterized protein n=1 Tax=Akanthomyces muscarius TaxID=2231603 RepID=A0A9W8Q8H9_AKAMU|nr:hypothetical protein LMH87_010678 [Akanthomyces muscarius]KAJ4149904.1 hypothetical protein LMH87_010678 [Akanthomyces muscarius]